ncbi:unnamed protein product [Schistosoma curassoni]|uniref:Uncharacterized protein n=1 Tax=Schistosoma curassoni TaxID=6186 RepID=A0A183L798_9TREM|nr:unnamed protein product [Schistosoma curassoni]
MKWNCYDAKSQKQNKIFLYLIHQTLDRLPTLNNDL